MTELVEQLKRIADSLERIGESHQKSGAVAPFEAAEDPRAGTLLGKELGEFFSVRAHKAIRRAWEQRYPLSPIIGGCRIRHALEFTAAEVLDVRGSGPGVVCEMREKLATVGLKLRGD